MGDPARWHEPFQLRIWRVAGLQMCASAGAGKKFPDCIKAAWNINVTRPSSSQPAASAPQQSLHAPTVQIHTDEAGGRESVVNEKWTHDKWEENERSGADPWVHGYDPWAPT